MSFRFYKIFIAKYKTMAVKPPANKSSAMMPIPPDTFLSSQLIGQGFNISKNLNIKKLARIQPQETGTKIIANHIPTISSHTIPLWS